MADYDYLPASNGSGDAALMHITVDRLTGSTTITVDSIANVPAKFIGTSGTLDASGFITSATKKEFKGHISGSTLVIDSLEPGYTDTGNTAGQVVVIRPSTGWSNRVAAFIKNSTSFGTPEAVTFASLVATAISAASAVLSGTLTVGGNATVTGNIDISGTSRLVPGTTVTADGANNVTPSKQVYSVTALAIGATILAPTWPAQEMMTGVLKIKDDGIARAIAWNAAWVVIGVTLPTATAAGKWLYVSYQYNAADSKFHVLGIARQA